MRGKRIAEGQTATVYSGTWGDPPETGVEVALKEMKYQQQDEEQITQIEKELSILK